MYVDLSGITCAYFGIGSGRSARAKETWDQTQHSQEVATRGLIQAKTSSCVCRAFLASLSEQARDALTPTVQSANLRR
jgi:hypothetical protein